MHRANDFLTALKFMTAYAAESAGVCDVTHNERLLCEVMVDDHNGVEERVKQARVIITELELYLDGGE